MSAPAAAPVPKNASFNDSYIRLHFVLQFFETRQFVDLLQELWQIGGGNFCNGEIHEETVRAWNT
jgi:hypothetical protein